MKTLVERIEALQSPANRNSEYTSGYTNTQDSAAIISAEYDAVMAKMAEALFYHQIKGQYFEISREALADYNALGEK